ncbi:hypothetical protein [Paraburkholderia dipogonis]|uniref:hypothetical protein n=1 Tax=Paraburkholderia dipogonis TaxID=1211383 RepID=UPI0038BCB80A
MWGYDFAVQHWIDIKTNLYASAIAFPFEALLTFLVVDRVVTHYDNKRWRPARRNVAQKLFDVHRLLFNAAHHVVDPDFHIDRRGHGIREDVSQEAADHWGKKVFIGPLDFTVDAFKKTIEYNNAALDSTLLPIVSDFVVHADKLLENIKFLLPAYDPLVPNVRVGFLPLESLQRMQECYDFVVHAFPEIKKATGAGPLTILSANDLETIYRNAAERNPKIEFIEPVAQ